VDGNSDRLGEGDDPVSWIGNTRGTGITDYSKASPLSDKLIDKTARLGLFVIILIGNEPLGLDPKEGEEFASYPRILGSNDIHRRKNPEGTGRQVIKMPNGSGNDIYDSGIHEKDRTPC
jgi:hypothetical protein